MESLYNILNVLSLFILMSSFVLVANKRVFSYINTFRIQSLLLSMIGIILSIHTLIVERKFEGVIIISILIVLLKVVYIPQKLKSISSRVDYKVEKDFFLNIPVSILICCGLVILTWFIVSKIPDFENHYNRMFLTNSISVVLIGLFFMVSRKKALGQIIGFLVIENGMFMAAILTTSGMPLIVELGLFFDLLVAVIVMGMLVFKINESFESIDINKLKNLKG